MMDTNSQEETMKCIRSWDWRPSFGAGKVGTRSSVSMGCHRGVFLLTTIHHTTSWAFETAGGLFGKLIKIIQG